MEPRTKRISVRVTVELHDRCVATANHEGRDVAAWVRWTLQQATTKPAPSSKPSKASKRPSARRGAR